MYLREKKARKKSEKRQADHYDINQVVTIHASDPRSTHPIHYDINQVVTIRIRVSDPRMVIPDPGISTLLLAYVIASKSLSQYTADIFMVTKLL